MATCTHAAAVPTGSASSFSSGTMPTGSFCSPPLASSSIFSMDRGPSVVRMMSATAWTW